VLAGVGKTRLAREAVPRVAASGRGGVVDRRDGVGQDAAAGAFAHLLDVLSAALLHQFAIERQVRLIVTVRTGEPLPDAVTALWKDGHPARVELPPLSWPDTVGLMERVLDGPVESHRVQRRYDASQGYVLFLRHIVASGLVAGQHNRRPPQCRNRFGALLPELRDLAERLSMVARHHPEPPRQRHARPALGGLGQPAVARRLESVIAWLDAGQPDPEQAGCPHLCPGARSWQRPATTRAGRAARHRRLGAAAHPG
jgi:hypothetical protein